jgi:hypothetical protein
MGAGDYLGLKLVADRVRRWHSADSEELPEGLAFPKPRELPPPRGFRSAISFVGSVVSEILHGPVSVHAVAGLRE